jgi:hypothetical protein
MGEKRYELKRTWSDIKWVVLIWFCVGTVIWLTKGNMEWQSLLVIPVTIVTLGALSELIYRWNNYVIFHPDFFDESEDDWGFRGKWHHRRGRTRVPYSDISSVRLEGDLIEVEFQIDPLEQRWSWPPVEYHGRRAILRFRAARPKDLVDELSQRVLNATGNQLTLEYIT